MDDGNLYTSSPLLHLEFAVVRTGEVFRCNTRPKSTISGEEELTTVQVPAHPHVTGPVDLGEGLRLL